MMYPGCIHTGKTGRCWGLRRVCRRRVRSDDLEMLGSGIPPKEIGVDDINVWSFVERLGDLIDQILTHDVVIELM